MTLSLEHQVNAIIDRLKAKGEPTFCPADIGKEIGTDSKQVIAKVRDRQDIYRIERAKNYGGRSLWGFR